MLTHRPCGACRALVLATVGCEHWHVRRLARDTAYNERRRRQRAQERAERAR